MDEQLGETPDRIESATRPVTAAPHRTVTPRGRRLRSMSIVLALVLLAVGAWRLFWPHEPAHRRTEHAAQPIGAATIASGDLREDLAGLGTVTPLATITVQTQINGQLMSVGFKEGQIVQKGDFLAQIDPRPYQAALDQAEGDARPRQRAARAGQVGSAALPNPRPAGQHRRCNRSPTSNSSSSRTKARSWRTRRDRDRQAQPRLLPYRRPGDRPRRAAARRSRQLRTDHQHDRSRRADPAAADLGRIRAARRPDSAVWQEVRAGRRCPSRSTIASTPTLIATGALESVDNEIDTTTGTVKLRATFANADEACSRTSSSTPGSWCERSRGSPSRRWRRSSTARRAPSSIASSPTKRWACRR